MRWVVLLVLASCGDNIPMIASGSRLEAIVDVGGEDAEAIAYYRDASGDFECEFAQDAAGEWRCFPRPTAQLAGFVDAECLQPILECRDCGDQTLAVLRETGCAGIEVTPLRLTAAPAPSFIQIGDACVSAVFPTGGYYTATIESTDAFAAATFEDHPVTDTLGTRTLVTDDGAHELFHHAFERTGGQHCSFFGGISGRCLPGTVARTELGRSFFFAEAGCTSRVVFTSSEDMCPPPTHARFEGAIHTLSTLAEPAFERSPIDSSCAPTTQPDLAFFAIGPVDGTLPTANVIALGTGAARPVYYATNGSPLAFAHRWVDIDGMTCTPLSTVAGRRCIGRSLSLFPANVRYADVACSIELVPNPEGDIYALRWEGATIERDVTERSTVASVHALRAYPATEMYEMRDGFCTLSPDPAVLMAFVGLPLDLQTFPSVERRPAE